MRLPLCDLRRAIDELTALRGLHVDNVYQVAAQEFLFKLTPGPVHLIVGTGRDRARVLVTDHPPAVPDSPPVFGAILRDALRGGRWLGAMLLGEDRVIALDFDCGDSARRVVVEAFARQGNLLLLDADGVVERVIDGAVAKRRGTGVGANYTPPPAPEFTDDASCLPKLESDDPFAVNHALDAMFRAEGQEARAKNEERDRERLLKRLKKGVRTIQRELDGLPDAPKLRRDGETLLTHYAQLKKGARSFRGIGLDPKLSPQENIERTFELARKAIRAQPILSERLVNANALLARVEAGEPVEERELPSTKPTREAPRKPFRVFLSRDGRRILVGKGGADNDKLTMKIAGPHDLFLHVRNSPGSHVIVPLQRGESVPQETLLDAASLALHYSKMRSANAVEVSYTPRRNVSKPKGAKAGLVSVKQEKVLRLRREPDRVARLLATPAPPE